MKTELIVFRHGETDWNREHRSMGKTDIPLNVTGLLQADRLAARLASEHLDACYSSPLMRARQTMEMVARVHRLPVTFVPDLREMDLGLFEGKLKVDRVALSPNFDPGDDDERERLGMDTFRTWVPRLRDQTIRSLLSRHDGQTIALSTHDQKMRAVLMALGMPEETKRTVMKNTAVTKIMIDDGNVHVVFHNDTSHGEDSNPHRGAA